MSPTPTPNSIRDHFLKDIEHISGTNDLWLAHGTRALKNPEAGQFMLMLLGPATAKSPPYQTLLCPLGGYLTRGYAKIYCGDLYKVHVHTPTPLCGGYGSEIRRNATVFTDDYASARRLLVVLAKELVYDR